AAVGQDGVQYLGRPSGNEDSGVTSCRGACLQAGDESCGHGGVRQPLVVGEVDDRPPRRTASCYASKRTASVAPTGTSGRATGAGWASPCRCRTSSATSSAGSSRRWDPTSLEPG